jgi:hypothetical protein
MTHGSVTAVQLPELLTAMIWTKPVLDTDVSLAVIAEHFVGEDENLLTPSNRTPEPPPEKKTQLASKVKV